LQNTTVQGSLQISSIVKNQWLAGGQDTQSNANIKYSSDGLNWLNSAGQGFTSQANGFAWNGLRWVAVGQGGSNILTSLDGVTWSTTNASFTTAGQDVKWNGRIFVAVGQDATASIKYSANGLSWSNANSAFTTAGLGLTWNGFRWIAVGQDATASIKYSVDGTNWLNATGSFSMQGSAVTWNGRIFVAVGQDATNSIKYSANGITWSNATSGAFSVKGSAIGWNGRLFVAVGQDATNSIKYSYNGLQWLNATATFTTAGLGVAWNGSYWVAVGQDSTANIKISQDGINWLNAVGSPFTTKGTTVAYTSNIQPSLQTQDLEINGNGQVSFLTSTNQIATGFSSLMILNNTVFIDGTNNRVGINTTIPQADLDVNGTLSKTTGSFDIVHPNPERAASGYRLRHCFVESPTRGDNLYRWLLSTVNKEFTLALPSYFEWLNEDAHCHVSPVDTFGFGRATVINGGKDLLLKTTEDGLWNVLCIATRKDVDAKNYFDANGVEYRHVPKLGT